MKEPQSKDIQASEDLRTLFNYPEWKTFAHMSQALMEKWKSNLIHYEAGFTIEMIALERVKWTAMIEGVQVLFVELNRVVEELKKIEKEKESARREKR